MGYFDIDERKIYLKVAQDENPGFLSF